MEKSKEELEEKKTYSFGWLPDYPDFRDYTEETPKIETMLKQTGVPTGTLPNPSVDLKTWFSPVEDQKRLGSCTANAAVGLVEYNQRRAHGEHIDASRLFIYKATRNLMHLTGDTGAYLRTTMQALVLFGAPPEEYWPYTDIKPTDPVVPTYHFDLEPPAFCYAYAQNYQAINYVRLDSGGIHGPTLLSKIKLYLAHGFPSMFGFTVYESISQSSRNGEIPFPCPSGDRALGGHAVVAAGYDDEKKIKNAVCGRTETKGALLIRNSWGSSWGERGYGWLPYEYVLKVMARDFWVLISQDWVNAGIFQ
jgi:C1A family cysteine protease